MTEINLAEVYHLLDRHAEAVELYVQGHGPAGVGEIINVFELRRAIHFGASLARSGQLEPGRVLLERTYTRAQELEAAGSVPGVAVELARLELEAGRSARAREWLARFDELPPTDTVAAEVAAIRAQASAATPPPRPRSRRAPASPHR
jgi:hypothetical protein